MSNLSDYLENELLDQIFSAAAWTSPSSVYVALATAISGDGTTFTEVTGGSYARVEITNNATQFPAASGGAKSNANAVTFPQATADWGNIVGMGIYDASSAGNQLVWGFLGSAAARPVSADAGTDTLTSHGHSFSDDDRVTFYAAPGGSLPTGLTDGTVYYVITSATDTFQVSATSGGSAVTITADGVCLAKLVTVKPVLNGDTPSFAANDIDLALF